MLLSNPVKSFLASVLLLFTSAGCGYLRTSENKAAAPVPELKRRLPFATKEPENYQCEVIVTAAGTARRYLLARRDDWRRTDFDPGEPNGRVILQKDKKYLIAVDKKIYAELSPKDSSAPDPQFSELTSILLGSDPHPEFEEVGRDKSIIKYRVRPGEDDKSEIYVFFDEAIGMPVKQEFYSVGETETNLQYSVEIVNFRDHADDALFAIPAGSRRVALSEFNASLRK